MGPPGVMGWVRAPGGIRGSSPTVGSGLIWGCAGDARAGVTSPLQP